MRTRDSVAFVTGANRGIGLAFVQSQAPKKAEGDET
jgi:NAD(P)-dependent dehydrogenase (short-subunit alcohol dehydrogenase family)